MKNNYKFEKRKDISELVFILDKSGSMMGKEEDIIGGFNSTIAKQRNKKYETLVTTVVFNDNYKIIHDRVGINSINKMTRDDYECSGCTALMDTIGETIEHINLIQKYAENKPKKTLFVIMTDGLENASHKYGSDDIKELISEQKKKEWEFIFMGANIDAVETAKTYGINESRAANFSTEHIDKFYKSSQKVMDIALNPEVSYSRQCSMLNGKKWAQDLDDEQ